MTDASLAPLGTPFGVLGFEDVHNPAYSPSNFFTLYSLFAHLHLGFLSLHFASRRLPHDHPCSMADIGALKFV